MAETQIAQLEQLVHGDLQPDLTLYLDLPWDLAAERIAHREPDRLESEPREFFNAVRSAYLARAQRHPRIQVVSAAESLAEVQHRIGRVLASFVEQQSQQAAKDNG